MNNGADSRVDNQINDRVKDAFDAICAQQELKDKTSAFLAQRTRRFGAGKTPAYRRILPAAVCCFLLLLGFGGYNVYFTAVSVISIDVNPSIELGVNRFEKVVSVKGYNDDGDRLAMVADVRFMGYREAVERILADGDIADYLARNEVLSIVVVEPDEEQGRRMLANLSSCVSGHENVHCHSADAKAVEAAHEEGLSYGKYWAFLRLRELDPEITAEEIQGMTMREIADLFYLLQPGGAENIWHESEEEEWHESGEDVWHESEEDGWHDGGHHERGHGHGRE